MWSGLLKAKGQPACSTPFGIIGIFTPTDRRLLRQWKAREYTVEMLCAYFRGRRLKDITPMLIEGFRRKRLSEKTQYKKLRKPCTVKMEITVLSSIFTLAQDNDLVGLNPCRKLRWKREEIRSRRERVLDADEEMRLMAALSNYPEARSAATLALHTGLRRMEILSLRLADVNLNTNRLSVVGKGGKKRVVPLNPVAEKTVRELMSSLTSDGFLFHSRTGNTLSHKQGAFQSAVCAAKIPDLHFHDLRHTFSTRMRALTDPFTLKEILGHSKIETTEGYVTPSMAEMQAAVEGLAQTTARVLPLAAARA